MKKIFIVTGEHSGDIHASYIVRELRKLNPDIKIEAIGIISLKLIIWNADTVLIHAFNTTHLVPTAHEVPLTTMTNGYYRP